MEEVSKPMDIFEKKTRKKRFLDNSESYWLWEKLAIDELVQYKREGEWRGEWARVQVRESERVPPDRAGLPFWIEKFFLFGWIFLEI